MQLLGRLVEALQGTVHEQERYIDQVYVCMIYVCMYPLPILRVCVCGRHCLRTETIHRPGLRLKILGFRVSALGFRL